MNFSESVVHWGSISSRGNTRILKMLLDRDVELWNHLNELIWNWKNSTACADKGDTAD